MSDGSRRRLLIFALSATVFSVMHHVDHVIRGNHSGGPFQAEVTPFAFGLLIYALIAPAIYLSARRRDVAGYHLLVAVVGPVLIGTVHFVPTDEQESPITTPARSTAVLRQGLSRWSCSQVS